MKNAGTFALAALVAATAAASACANSEDAAVDGGPPDAGEIVRREAGGAGRTTAEPAGPTGSEPGTPGTAGEDDGGPGGGDDGGTAGEGGTPGGSPGGSPGTSACAPTNACPATVKTIGALDGDQNAGQLTATGTRGDWLVFRLNEGSASISSADLKARVTLTSPPGADYAFRVYYDNTNNGATAYNCAALKASSSGTTTSKSVDFTWPDTQGIGGHDDSSNVTVEIFHVSGTCDPNNASAQWQLLVEGNKP